MGDDEPDLVAAARRGDERAVSLLFARHWAPAVRVAAAVCGGDAPAEDVAQEALVRAFAALHRFDGRRPFAVWLQRIVVNTALNHRRRTRREAPLDEAPDPSSPAPPDGDPRLHAALAALPPDQRVAVALRYAAGLPPADIAAALGVPEGTVNSRLGRALARLRADLSREGARDG